MMVRRIEANKEDIDVLLKNAKSRIVSAKGLLKLGQFNDAVSRAYYAFFDTAAAALLSKGLIVKTHGGLKTLFNLHFIKTGAMPMKFQRYLNKAFEARQEADYNARAKFNKAAVEAAITSAQEFIAAVEKIVQEFN